jgi:hypothetical protein
METLKASDLVRLNKQRLESRRTNYALQVQKFLDEIQNVNDFCHKDHTFLSIPMTMTDPNYDHIECLDYVKSELRKAEFHVKRMSFPPNQLFVSWAPTVPAAPSSLVIEHKPMMIGSGAILRANLMKTNPKYAHLKSISKSNS